MVDDVAPFLTARWVDLALVTYRIPADLLRPLLAPGLEPDRLEGDDEDVAYVSLVGFRFLDTRVKGVAVPLHTDFPEVNLRAYVREPGADRRGVTFIAELVPKPAIAVVANLLYHEHYRAVPMTMDTADLADGSRRVEYTVDVGGRVHRMAVVGRRPTQMPSKFSLEHFFKEHEWGFGKDGDGELVVYRVHHPVWEIHPTGPDALELDWGFAELYGGDVGGGIGEELDRRRPFHVALAVGSEIAVFPRES